MKKYLLSSLREDIFSIKDTIFSWHNILSLPIPSDDTVNNLSILWQTDGKDSALKSVLSEWADLQTDIQDKVTLINTKFDEIMGTATAISKPAVFTGIAVLTIGVILLLIFLGRQKE